MKEHLFFCLELQLFFLCSPFYITLTKTAFPIHRPSSQPNKHSPTDEPESDVDDPEDASEWDQHKMNRFQILPIPQDINERIVWLNQEFIDDITAPFLRSNHFKNPCHAVSVFLAFLTSSLHFIHDLFCLNF